MESFELKWRFIYFDNMKVVIISLIQILITNKSFACLKTVNFSINNLYTIKTG